MKSVDSSLSGDETREFRSSLSKQNKLTVDTQNTPLLQSLLDLRITCWDQIEYVILCVSSDLAPLIGATEHGEISDINTSMAMIQADLWLSATFLRFIWIPFLPLEQLTYPVELRYCQI